MKKITLTVEPLLDVADGLCVRFDKPSEFETCFAVANIYKGQTVYELPIEKGRKVIAVYLRLK